MENVNDRKLSFPQRNWLLLCIIVAILSPLLVHSVRTLAHKHRYEEAIQQKSVKGGDGATSPSGGAVAPGDTARPGSVNPMGATNKDEVKDTSYKVAAPPQHK